MIYKKQQLAQPELTTKSNNLHNWNLQQKAQPELAKYSTERILTESVLAKHIWNYVAFIIKNPVDI